MAQLWGGRFTKQTDKLVYNFNASISFDQKFYKQDIEGSIAHVRMLGKQGILTGEEMQAIVAWQLPCASPMRRRTSGSATWVPAVVSLRLGVVNKAAMVAPVLIGPIRLDSAYLLDVAGGSAVWRAKWPKWGRNRPHAGAGTGAKRKARGRMATPRFIVQLLQPCPYATKK